MWAFCRSVFSFTEPLLISCDRLLWKSIPQTNSSPSFVYQYKRDRMLKAVGDFRRTEDPQLAENLSISLFLSEGMCISELVHKHMNKLVKCIETTKPWLGAGQFGWAVTHLSFSASALAVVKVGTNPSAPHLNCALCAAAAFPAKKWLFLEALRHPAWASRIKTVPITSTGLFRPLATFSHKSTTRGNYTAIQTQDQNKTPAPHSNYFCLPPASRSVAPEWIIIFKEHPFFGSSSKHFSIS